MRSSYYIIMALLLCVHTSVGARDYPMRHFTTADGLPSNTIYQVFRDSKGFLWIGTDKGVARYNGIQFEKFTTFNGLADNEVFLFTEDKYGRIWMGTYNGELCYYKDDSFHTAANTPFLNLQVKFPYIYNITDEADSSITFNFQDKGVVLNIKGKYVRIVKMPYADSENRRRSFGRKRKDGNYVSYYNHGIAKPSYGTSLVVDSNGHVKETIKARFRSGMVWVVNQGHTYFLDSCNVYDEDCVLIKKIRYPFSEINKPYSYYDDGKNYMVGLNKRLLINDTLALLEGKWISSITQDSYGTYWIGTHEDGIYCMSRDINSTALIENAYRSRISRVQRAGSDVYMATDVGDLYRMRNGSSKLVFESQGMMKENTRSIGNDLGVLIDDHDTYYGLYTDKAVRVNNIGSEHPTKLTYAIAVPEFVSVKAMFTQGGYLYANMRDRIFREHKEKLGKPVHSWDTVLYLLDKERLFASAQFGDSSIWYTTLKNVYKVVDGKPVLQTQFRGVSFKKFDFFGDKLIGLTHYNNLVVCSDIAGAPRFDTVHGQNCIWERITRLDSNHALISTDGLYRVLTLTPGNAQHPYIVSVIEDPFVPLTAEAICASDTKCFFFANKNVTIIDKWQLLAAVAPPKITFTSLTTSSGKQMIGNDISIPFADARHINISFSTLSEWGQGMTWQYSVSRDGDDDQWVNLSGKTIDLIDPGYGQYTVRIHARSLATGYGNVAQFTLNIASPFWASWWFLLLCVLAGVAVIVVVVRVRLRYIVNRSKKAHETEVKFMRSEYKALNALMNPHFIFNTLNNVQGLFNENDKEAANTYLRIFADLIRQNMHNVSKEVISLQKEMELVMNYLRLEELRFEDKLSYSVDVAEDVDLAEIMIPPLLIQPIVENCIKHGILPLAGGQGKIWITIAEQGTQLIVEVRDNGVGIGGLKKDANQLHESFGLANIRKRVEQLSIMQGKKMSFELVDMNDDAGNITGSRATLIIET